MSTSRPGPSFSRFIVTGAIIGFIAGGVASLTGDPYLGIFGAAIGAMLAAVVAVLLDRRR